MKAPVVLALHRFHKGGSLLPYTLRVALGGVQVLFIALPVQPLHRPPERGPAAATSHTRNSSKAASGCWRRQATSTCYAATASSGAGPPRWGNTATLPLLQLVHERNGDAEARCYSRQCATTCAGSGHPLTQIVAYPQSSMHFAHSPENCSRRASKSVGSSTVKST